MKSVIDFKKHPYHGVGFSSIPELGDALIRHTPFTIESDHCVKPTTGHVSRKVLLSTIRNAIVKSGIKIRDEDMTKDGQYRSDWIVLDEYALAIAPARRGGYVAILEARETFNKERARWNRDKSVVLKRAELRKQALAKLTAEDRNVLGV